MMTELTASHVADACSARTEEILGFGVPMAILDFVLGFYGLEEIRRITPIGEVEGDGSGEFEVVVRIKACEDYPGGIYREVVDATSGPVGASWM